jgi:hypothetical protein
MTVCERCGTCCHFNDETGRKRKCKFLVKLKNGKTLCRVFNTRLGRLLYQRGEFKVYCHLMENIKAKYPGCPFNEGKE